ncbi:chemotaxis protein CheD [Sulfitobacter sabulilitoris]|uniref:Probable chemoreceptor glutamine deamidase CheD n=1 Tax=Sulfitobacter sabulilitoris TaxID=2562655 RepID=A0A5S3PM63_9RHOB|nr:chemotaxis protein CheD [Sulfitobacter sabulilitoris]TMM54670.1 chemotaxis protein CheD [Sulfitobacter sabulilitoris]
MPGGRILITQGQRAVGNCSEVVIATLLGSCVACCIWDEEAGVGGMNHMLLTVSAQKTGMCNMVGVNAMELLINDILKLGGQRNRLRAKAFGGAQMVAGLSDVGTINAAFTLEYLNKEGIACMGHSLGGTTARSILFWPATGRVLQKTNPSEKPEAPRTIAADKGGNGIELL